MDKYWLIIDSYTFIWNNEISVVVYNSLSGQGFEYPLSSILKRIVEEVVDEKNMYCVEITASVMQDSHTKTFLTLLREYFCGDIIKKLPESVKPVSVLPLLNINEEVGRDFGDVANFEAFGHHVVKNLLEITVYLNGDPVDERNPSRQFLWSCKGKPVLDKQILEKIARQIEFTRVVDFNVVTSDLFSYPYLNDLFSLLERFSLKTTFYLPCNSLTRKNLASGFFKRNDFQLCLLVNCPEEIEEVDLSVFAGYNVQFLFKVMSVEEYLVAIDKIEQYQLNAKVLPYYNGHNYAFFKEYIFLDKEDILNTQWTKQQIFAHQVLNTNDFGKFVIMPDGKIYANINFKAVGTVDNDIKELVYKEMKEGISWRRTRNSLKKCSTCLYRHLCPSPSNYEVHLGKDNLCSV